jgi:hypothetical protein
VAVFGRITGLAVTVDFDRTMGFALAVTVRTAGRGRAAAVRTAAFGFAAGLRTAAFGFAAGLRTAAFGFAAGLRTAALGLAAGLRAAAFGFAAGLRTAAFGLAAGLRAAAFAFGFALAVAFFGRAGAAGLAADIVLADTVSALAALLIAFVAVLMACMAVDRVLADAVALVAAEVSRVAAVVTFAAADETVRAAVTVVGMVLAAPAFSALTDFLVGFRLLAVFLLVALVLALAFGRLAALLDGLLRSARPGAAFAEPRRLAVRVLLCTGIDLPPMLINYGELFHDYSKLTPVRAKECGRGPSPAHRAGPRSKHIKAANHCHRTRPVDRDRATLSGPAISDRAEKKVAAAGPAALRGSLGLSGRPT